MIRRLLRGALKRARGEALPAEPPRAVPEPARTAPEPPPAKARDDRSDRAWYLQPDTDGWDATNPGSEPERKNLKE